MELRGFKNCGHRPLYIFYEFAETNKQKWYFFPLWLTFLRDSSKFQKNIYHLLPEIERKRKTCSGTLSLYPRCLLRAVREDLLI